MNTNNTITCCRDISNKPCRHILWNMTQLHITMKLLCDHTALGSRWGLSMMNCLPCLMIKKSWNSFFFVTVYPFHLYFNTKLTRNRKSWIIKWLKHTHKHTRSGQRRVNPLSKLRFEFVSTLAKMRSWHMFFAVV